MGNNGVNIFSANQNLEQNIWQGQKFINKNVLAE